MKYLYIESDGSATTSSVEPVGDELEAIFDGDLAVYKFEGENFYEASVQKMEEDNLELSWSVVDA